MSTRYSLRRNGKPRGSFAEALPSRGFLPVVATLADRLDRRFRSALTGPPGPGGPAEALPSGDSSRRPCPRVGTGFEPSGAVGPKPGASVCLPAVPRHRCEAAPSGGGRSLLPPKPGAAATQSVSGCPATLSADHRTVPSGPKPFRELPGRPCGHPENPSRICRSRPVRGPCSGPKARRGSGKLGRRRDPVNRDSWLDFARNRRDFATDLARPELHRCGFCRCRSV